MIVCVWAMQHGRHGPAGGSHRLMSQEGRREGMTQINEQGKRNKREVMKLQYGGGRRKKATLMDPFSQVV
jgi:hypothetical protein